MKNIIYTALLCITSIAFSQEKKENTITTTNTQITFGRQSLDCRGRGTCNFEKVETKENANATATYNKDKTVTLIIDRTKITKEDDIKIFGKPLNEVDKASALVFVMEADFVFKRETKLSLKIPEQITKIAQGEYPIKLTKETITITLKLE